MTARQLAYEALLKTARDGSYSNLTLDALLKAHPMEPRETQFASRLFYGVLERKLTLDYQIELLTKKPVHKLDPEVAASLELGRKRQPHQKITEKKRGGLCQRGAEKLYPGRVQGNIACSKGQIPPGRGGVFHPGVDFAVLGAGLRV